MTVAAKRIGVIVLAVILACAFPKLFAQTSATGGLNGTVTDSSGAVIAGATVTITSASTNQTRTAKTGSDGSYKFTLLPPDTYRVRFEAQGFRAVEVPSVTVAVTETAVLNRSLEVGAQAQEITVVGSATEAIQTESSTLGTLVPSKIVTDLPLSSRNFTDLLSMSAGANASVDDAISLGKAGVNVAINGASGYQNNYLMDGVSITNFEGYGNAVETAGIYAAIPILNPDAIQEFKIQTSSIDAGYGRNVGANVDVVTKSGSNDFHGTAFEFFRNTALNANDYFRNATGGSKLAFDQNQFGGVLGGPIKKDKLFFFVSYEETHQKNGISALGYSSVTLPPIPTGNRGSCPVGWTSLSQCNAAGQAFVGALGNAVCPTNPANAAYKKFDTSTLTGGIQVACDGSNINPAAINILQLTLPNGSYYIPGSGSSNAYLQTTFSDPATYTEHQGFADFDYSIDNKNTLRGSFLDAPSLNNGPIGCGTCLPGAPFTAEKDYRIAGLRLTSVMSNSLVNEGRIFFTDYNSLDSEPNPLTNSSVGMQDLTSYDAMYYISTGLFQIGENWFENTNNPSYSYTLSDDLSWTRGKHSVRVGVEYRNNKTSVRFTSIQDGNPTFGSFPDFLIGRAACAAGTFGSGPGQCNASNPGNSNGTSQSSVSSVGGSCAPGCAIWMSNSGQGYLHFTAPELDAFIQDDIRVNSRLTVNAGVRWEYDGFPSEDNGEWSAVWLGQIQTQPYPGNTPATGSLAGFVAPSNFQGAIPPGVFQTNNTSLPQTSASLHNFGPRLGFAWQPLSGNRFVLRGGGGIFYDRIPGNVLTLAGLGDPPYNVPISSSPNATLQNPMVKPYTIPGPPGTPGWTPRWVDYTTGASSNLIANSLNQDLSEPVVYQWNLNSQYEFLPNWVLEVGYVGAHGIHQIGLSGQGYNSGPPINTAVMASPSVPVCAGNSNPADCVTTNTVANASLRVPYLGFSPIWAPDQSGAAYSFNSLQATVRKQLSHGVLLQTAYTWSRDFIPYYIGNPNPAPGAAPYDTVWGLSSQYHPQRLVINYSWNIPNAHFRGFLGKALSGWMWAGVTTFQDGTPLTILDSRAGTAFNPVYSAQSSGVTATAQFCPGMGLANIPTSGSLESRLGLGGGQGYMNKSAFCAPSVIGSDGLATTWGNSPANDLLGPGQNNWDMTLAKTTTVGGLRENGALEFRAEFFNTFNHPQFSNPANNVASGTFGEITSTSVSPRLIQLGLKYLF